MADQSALRLMNELKGLQKKLPEGFSAAPTDECDLFKWDIMIIGPPDTPYEGGLFEATMMFPRDYPLNPPELRFKTYVHHPNVYPDGKVCISILHPPGEDIYGYEEASERWLPIYTVETIIVNVVCMLSSPNDESPANVDVAKQWRENYPLYRRAVRRIVERTIEGDAPLVGQETPQVTLTQQAQQARDTQEAAPEVEEEEEEEEKEEEEEDYMDDFDDLDEVEEVNAETEEVVVDVKTAVDEVEVEVEVEVEEEGSRRRKRQKRDKRQQRRNRRHRHQLRKRREKH